LFSPTAETESFSGGEAPPSTVPWRGARVSGFVCYDLRFPELTRRCFEQRAQLLCIPAQWPNTRATHFRALAIGQAVLGQCFVIACNRTGRDVIGRRRMQLDFPGNSLLVDPHGVVLAEGAGRAGLVTADFDLALARDLRAQVPVARDRRPELYTRWLSHGAL
jgi:predicted amidohydrolase